MRLRITFAKTNAMRFTGHLDLQRAWERTLRRARLPLVYSLGFNPHPRINLACALPLGFTSQGEVVDVWLEKDLPIPDVEVALQTALPPGIQLLSIQEAEARADALQTQVEASEYIITLLEPCPDLEDRCAALLDAPSFPRRRRSKDYDLRPLIYNLNVLPEDEQGNQRLFTCLSARESSTGRPEEVLDALGLKPEETRVHRVRLVFS
jgi:radical SAM-linked protein